MKNKPKLLIITVRADYGGGPEHIFRLLPFIVKEYDVYIACPKDEPYYDKFSELVGSKRIIVIPHRKFSIPSYIKLLKLIWLKNISIVHSHGKGAGIYSRLFKFFAFVKVFHTFHGIHTGNYSTSARSVYTLLEHFLSLLTEKCIAVSITEVQRAIKEKICTKSKIELIFNGVNVPDFKVEYNEKFPKNILHVSRFDYAKNSRVLIDIAKEMNKQGILDKYQFTIAGDGEERKSIEEEIISLGFSEYFNFAGFHKDLTYFYSNAFIYLSVSRWEGMPLSVMEAKSFGVPPVVTDVSGNKDLVVNSTTGFTFTQGDIKKCIASIERLTNEKELWEKMSLSTRTDIILNYTIDKSAENLISLYKKDRG